MLAARMHNYRRPLVLEDVEAPEIKDTEVLVRVGAAGICRSDFQMLEGYFSEALKLPFPAIPGHEIAGSVAEIGSLVPATSGLTVGDQVLVVGGCGDGTCRHCHIGDEQICGHGVWPGFGKWGGYRDFVPVPSKYLIRIDKKYNLQVVLFARTDEKLTIAEAHGADYTINTRGKALVGIRAALQRLTGQEEIDGAIDFLGAEGRIRTGFGLLATGGTFVSVWLVGNRIDIPLFPFVAHEHTYHGSFWGSYGDLSEVMALAQSGKIRHSLKRIRLEAVNENPELMREGEPVGRAVIMFAEGRNRIGNFN